MIQENFATFAGGCFWCMQPVFDNVGGVLKTTVGYAGGTGPNPTYHSVSSGQSDYVEAIQIVYDPAKVNFETLLTLFLQNIDPTDAQGQFADKGPQYQTVIFFNNPIEEQLALKAKEELAQALKLPIYTDIKAYTNFYPAEDSHQKYYQTNSVSYKLYSQGSGRAKQLEALWKKKS